MSFFDTILGLKPRTGISGGGISPSPYKPVQQGTAGVKGAEEALRISPERSMKMAKQEVQKKVVAPAKKWLTEQGTKSDARFKQHRERLLKEGVNKYMVDTLAREELKKDITREGLKGTAELGFEGATSAGEGVAKVGKGIAYAASGGDKKSDAYKFFQRVDDDIDTFQSMTLHPERYGKKSNLLTQDRAVPFSTPARFIGKYVAPVASSEEALIKGFGSFAKTHPILSAIGADMGVGLGTSIAGAGGQDMSGKEFAENAIFDVALAPLSGFGAKAAIKGSADLSRGLADVTEKLYNAGGKQMEAVYDVMKGMDIDTPKEKIGAFLDAVKNMDTKTGGYSDIGAIAEDMGLASRGKFTSQKPFKERTLPEETLSKQDLKPKKKVIDSINPTGGVHVEYTPEERATGELAQNMTTLAETARKKPDDMVIVYRGAPSSQKELNPGDFISTDINSAQSYVGNGGHLIEQKVRYGDILDDLEDSGNGDYLYRPGADKEIAGRKYDHTKSEWFSNYVDYLRKNKDKFSSMEDWISKNKISGKTRKQLEDVYNAAYAKSTGKVDTRAIKKTGVNQKIQHGDITEAARNIGVKKAITPDERVSKLFKEEIGVAPSKTLKDLDSLPKLDVKARSKVQNQINKLQEERDFLTRNLLGKRKITGAKGKTIKKNLKALDAESSGRYSEIKKELSKLNRSLSMQETLQRKAIVKNIPELKEINDTLIEAKKSIKQFEAKYFRNAEGKMPIGIEKQRLENMIKQDPQVKTTYESYKANKQDIEKYQTKLDRLSTQILDELNNKKITIKKKRTGQKSKVSDKVSEQPKKTKALSSKKQSKSSAKPKEKISSKKTVAEKKAPVKTFESKVNKRLAESLPENMREKVMAKKITLKGETNKALKILEKDKKLAYRKAMGWEDGSELERTATNIALSQKALDEGNYKLYSKLLRNRSLKTTDIAQSLGMERASVADNSAEKFVKDLLRSRLDVLGRDATKGLENLKNVSSAKKGLGELELAAEEALVKVRKQRIKIKDAQNLLDSLICK